MTIIIAAVCFLALSLTPQLLIAQYEWSTGEVDFVKLLCLFKLTHRMYCDLGSIKFCSFVRSRTYARGVISYKDGATITLLHMVFVHK